MANRFFSIVQDDFDERKCYCCKTTRDIEIHHIFEGRQGYKEYSEDDGLMVCLCRAHHRDNRYGVHGNNIELTNELKARAQERWQEEYGKNATDFRKRYGKNYLED